MDKKPIIVRGDNQCRMSRMAGAEFAKSDEGAILLKGWAVTYNRVFPAIGEPKFIFSPDAISQDVIDTYMKKPIILKIHDDWEYAIGETLVMESREKGLWAEVIVRPAGDVGRSAVEQIKANPIRSFSIGFFMEEPAWDEQLGAYKITRVSELFDLSVVNLGRDEEAVFEIAQTFSKLMPEAAGNTRRRTMPEVKPITQEELLELQKDLDSIKVTVKDLDPEASAKLAKLERLFVEFKDNAGTTKAELMQLFNNLVDDFKGAMADMQKSYSKALERNIGDGERNDLPITPQAAIHSRPEALQKLFSPARYDQIREFRIENDMALLRYQMENPLSAPSGGASDKPMIINREAFSRLPNAKHLAHSAHRFAMDTATDAEGADFIPVGYSTEIISMIRLASMVDQLFPSFRMWEADLYKNREGDDILPTRHTQTTTAQTSRADSTEQTPGTDQQRFTAEKMRVRIQISGEMTEDSQIEIFDYVFGKGSIGYARGFDKIWVSGDKAAGQSFDSGDIPGSTDIRYCCNGLRRDAYYNQNTNSVPAMHDLSTFDFEGLCKLNSMMGKYATNRQQLAWLTSVESYFFNWLGKISKDYLLTREKAGPDAVAFNGQVNQFLGVPVILSEWVLATLDATGVYSGTGNTRSIEILVRRDAYERGIWRALTTEVVRNPFHDIWDVIMWHRGDIEKTAVGTAPTCVVGMNVPIS